MQSLERHTDSVVKVESARLHHLFNQFKNQACGKRWCFQNYRMQDSRMGNSSCTAALTANKTAALTAFRKQAQNI
jgi:hypothetical protein